jgi:hypothetical protein
MSDNSNRKQKLMNNITRKIKKYDLTNDDFVKIVKYYKLELPKTKRGTINKNKTRKIAYELLANKLCNCIKSVQKKGNIRNERGAIAICKKSVFEQKGLHSFRFTCKKKKALLPKKNTKKRLVKTQKKLTLRPLRTLRN